MGFGDLKQAAGLETLNNFLLTRSYIEGYQPSKADSVVFDCVSKTPDAKYANLLRWFNHIKSYGDQRKNFSGQAKDINTYGPDMSSTAKVEEEDDDDEDLFASEDEEEVVKRRLERVAAYEAKKEKKADKGPAKSMITLDVKPWDDETNMQELEKCVRTIKADSLIWGSSKLVPVIQGIKKLQITCVVEDDKVGTDFLETQIQAFDQYVQSIDIAGFNKL